MQNPQVAIEIGQGGEPWGRVVLELDADKAPKTCENFLQYVKDGFYDGTIFHRVIPTFMVQGGGYTSPQQVKTEGLRNPIENEAASGCKNERYAIAMARTSAPHSATSQFFINVADNPMLDHPGHDGWGYCAFGRVIEGQEVVDRIRDVETEHNPQAGEDSQPTNPPQIQRAWHLNG